MDRRKTQKGTTGRDQKDLSYDFVNVGLTINICLIYSSIYQYSISMYIYRYDMISNFNIFYCVCNGQCKSILYFLPDFVYHFYVDIISRPVLHFISFHTHSSTAS